MLLSLVLAAWVSACGRAAPGNQVVVGHVDHETVVLGGRFPGGGTFTLELVPADASGAAMRLSTDARAEDDWSLRWRAEALAAATLYDYRVEGPGGAVVAHGQVRTAPAPGAPARVRLVFGSCAALEDHEVWRRIADEEPDALVLLGDTPYIDTTGLGAARAAHRRFLAIPTLARLVRGTPLWSTWDDHDYGKDRGDGALPGKVNARRAYREARPQVGYGEGDEGIYTRVRYGPVEVFLLDQRYFAGLEPAASDASQRSLLGARQLQWLKDALRASTAPFKLLCGGMVWHHKGWPSSDDWSSYAAEREALFTFLGEEEIGGCVLLGGDVHACQHAVFTITGARYPLHEFVISPLHERVWRGGDRKHSTRRWGAVVPHVYLRIDVDTRDVDPRLEATWLDAGGRRLHTVPLRASDLGRRAR